MAKAKKIKGSHPEATLKSSKVKKSSSKISKEKKSKDEKKSLKSKNSLKQEVKSLLKKNDKTIKKKLGDDEVPSSLKQELEVFIKNLNKSGDLQKHFVLDDKDFENAEKNDESDEVLSTEDYDIDEEEDDENGPNETETAIPKKVNVEVPKVQVKSNGTKESNEGRADYIFVKEPRKERQNLLLKTKDGALWFSMLEAKPDIENLENGHEDSEYWLTKIEKFTKKIYEEELENFKNQGQKETKKSSEKRFMETVLKSGTLNDKISANAVMIQESPCHQLGLLQTLIDMVSLKSRRPCMLAMDALQSLFVNFLLVPERKLRPFSKCPIRHLDRLSGGNKDLRDKYLMMWWFEHQLKSLYGKFLEALGEVGKDTIENSRAKVLNVTLELLVSNPEQEQELLSRIVNKLGDPIRKIAAKAAYQIGILLEKHPAMKGVVLSEIERLLHRTNVSPKAQYYGICCLTQLILDDEEEDKIIANKLIMIYFAFFKSSIKKGEIDTKMVSALLAGVHRAYPFASKDSEVLSSQLETMYKIAHMSSFNIAIQAFMLLFQVMGSGEAVTDRFYNAFYKKLLSPDLPSTSKPALFLNLTYKVIKNDPSSNRATAFIKRLLQLAFYWPPSLTCSLMYLISEVVKSRPDISLTRKVEEADFGHEGKFDLGRFDDDGEADDYRQDVPLSDEESKDSKAQAKTRGSSWIHRNLSKTQALGSKATSYNPLDRNPMYSGAEKTNVWELSNLTKHFHPSAQMFSENIIHGSEIKYSGDPLADFTLMRFLDRFVFRNPKKDPAKNKPTNVFSKRNVYCAPSGVKRLAPDSKEYVDRDESSVPLDERFIFRFFVDKKAKISDPQDSDAGSVNSDDAMEALDMFAEKDPDDIDFASAIKLDKTGKKKKSQTESDDEDDSEDISDADSLIESDGEDLVEDDDNDFEEVDDFDGMEDDFEITPTKIKSATKKHKKLAKMADSGLMFASAEEFASMIDENEGDFDEGKHDQVLNKDRSAAKQLAWEKKRYSDSKPTFSKKFHGKKFSSKFKTKSKPFLQKNGKKKSK